MSKTATKFANAPSPDELRRTFETAIARIQHSDNSNSSQRPIAQRPIFQRAVSQRPIGVRETTMSADHVDEKRALTDAARALAQLWNISPTLVR